MEIQLKNVAFAYSRKTVIEDLDFTFHKGKSYALLGRSGVGKSTLLSLLKGFQKPTKGDINYLETTAEKLEVVFQDLWLFPWQTVFQTVEMPLKIKKIAKKRRTQIISDLLETFDLLGFEQIYPDQLSGGQRQRLAMARGLVSDPDFLLLDEPTASLDQETKEAAQHFILKEQKIRGNGLIVVTHDIEEAAFLGEMILILKEGKLRQVANPLFQQENRRDSLAFYEFCLSLRTVLKGEKK